MTEMRGYMLTSNIHSDPKTVTDDEYIRFYQATFKDYEQPLGWAHFSGDSAGTSFKAILYIPSRLCV